MFLQINFLSLLFLMTYSLHAIELTNNISTQKKLKTILQGVIPFGPGGKIEIPAHVKHVKLDIGLSEFAPISQYWLSHEDNLLVFGFEPNPACVTSILNGISKRGVPLDTKFIGKSFFLVPCALGLSENNLIKFYVTNDCDCSSIYFPKYFGVERVIDIPIFSLADFFDLFPFDFHPVIDYIKIDTQGSDLDIVKSAGHYLEERVIYVTLEAENSQYKDTVNSQQDIDDYMKNVGFIRYKTSNTEDPTYFNPRYSDYVKKHNVQIYQKG